VFENLKYIGGPPSVQMQDIPSDAMPEREEDEDKRNKDTRISSKYTFIYMLIICRDLITETRLPACTLCD